MITDYGLGQAIVRAHELYPHNAYHAFSSAAHNTDEPISRICRLSARITVHGLDSLDGAP